MEQNHMLARPAPPMPQGPTEKKGLDRNEASTADSLAALAALAPAPVRLQPSVPADPFLYNQAPNHYHARHSSPLPLHSKALQPPLPQPSLPSLHSQLPQSPPAYALSHEPIGLVFPDAPNAELAPIQRRGEAGPGAPRDTHLPSLSLLTGPQAQRFIASLPPPKDPSPPASVNHWPSLNPLTAYYTPSHVQPAEPPMKMDVDMGNAGSGTGSMSAASPDRYYDGRAGSVSLDDPDVRMAAEALGDLRADFVSSPPSRNTPLPSSPGDGTKRHRLHHHHHHHHPEPLLSLLTTSHPLLATTIEGATSAYINSKNFSPRFKSGAEYVEGCLTPIAKGVGNVGRVTGVEGSVRWFLGGGRRHQSSSDIEAADGASHKRRKVDTSGDHASDMVIDRTPAEVDLYNFTKERRLSVGTVDTLPAYDDHRSPAYSESADAQNQVATRPSSGASTAWQHRLIMSTSGLSVAMSEESLRSLKYCLEWLRWANEHIAKVIATLKETLEQYERPVGNAESGHDIDYVMADSGSPNATPESRSELAARINALKFDVLKTLKDVINTVSKYTGGALPENARELVKRHLTSLPQRFRLATMQDSSSQAQGQNPEAKEKEVKEGAQKVLVLAKEGLDMMSQVSGVLDGTIISAEEWCERLGKKKREQKDGLRAANAPQQPQPLTSVAIGGDIKTG